MNTEENKKESEIKINVENNDGKPIVVELIKRTGEAEEIKDTTEVLEETVTAESINTYIEGNKFEDDIKENKGVILHCNRSTNGDKPHITFKEDPTNNEAAILTCKFISNEELEAFHINEEVGFNAKQLKNLIRKSAHLFAEPAKAKTFIDQLNKYNATVTTEIKNEDDRQGSTERSVKEKLDIGKGQLASVLKLKAPIFNGTPKQDLDLEIEIDLDGNRQPLYSFYSLDIELKKVEVIDSEIKKVTEAQKSKFVVLEQ